MKNLRKKLLTLLSFLSVSALLSSCGPSELSNDTLVIGVDCEYQPFNWTAKNESEYTLPISGTTEHADGYDIQIAKYLSETLDKEVILKRIKFEALIPSLMNNDVNMSLGGISVTASREESVDFSDSYFSSDLAFLVKTTNMPAGFGTEENPASYDELLEFFNGKSLICQSNVIEDDFITTYFVNNPKNYKITRNSSLATFPLAASDVKAGNSFAMPGELPIVKAMANLGGLSVLYCDWKSFISEEDQNYLSVSIAVKEGNKELQEEINGALAKLSQEEREKIMGEASIRSQEASM